MVVLRIICVLVCVVCLCVCVQGSYQRDAAGVELRKPVTWTCPVAPPGSRRTAASRTCTATVCPASRWNTHESLPPLHWPHTPWVRPQTHAVLSHTENSDVCGVPERQGQWVDSSKSVIEKLNPVSDERWRRGSWRKERKDMTHRKETMKQRMILTTEKKRRKKNNGGKTER